MRRRTWLRSVILLGMGTVPPLLLAACAVGPGPTYAGGQPPSILAPGGPATPAAAARPIAILAPLSGPNAERGDSLVKAAQLALATTGSPRLDVHDTGGTAQGASEAAQAAVAAGAAVIIGPLTAAETTAAAGPALAAHVPVLAFTSDPAQARPGVWTLGLTPGQQTRRLVQSAMAEGRTHFAGLLPDNDFGHAMGVALAQEAAGADVRFHRTGGSAIRQTARDLSQYDQRVVAPPAPAPDASADSTPQPGIPAPAAAAAPPDNRPSFSGPPPFDAVLLADTGAPLAQLTAALANDGVAPPAVRMLGPALWAQASTRAGATLDGAWFAAPDPASRVAFDQAYTARYGTAAPGLADLAFDAATIARAAATSADPQAAVIRPDGFPGADGLLGLMPDGHVRRALALFEIHGGNAAIAEPAPASLNAPGS